MKKAAVSYQCWSRCFCRRGKTRGPRWCSSVTGFGRGGCHAVSPIFSVIAVIAAAAVISVAAISPRSSARRCRRTFTSTSCIGNVTTLGSIKSHNIDTLISVIINPGDGIWKHSHFGRNFFLALMVVVMPTFLL